MPFLLRIQKKYKEIAYKWYWQAGRLFKQMGNEAQAIVSYKKSISILSGIREELFNGIRLKMDIFDIDVKPVYLGLAEIYLDQADRESNPQVKETKNTTRQKRDGTSRKMPSFQIILKMNVLVTSKKTIQCIDANTRRCCTTLPHRPSGSPDHFNYSS
jgi:hypothetical protein